MRPLVATIDLSALRHNLSVARRHASRSKVFAVVKANAYGHGLLRAARALNEADGFAVVELEGAVRLREAGYVGHRIVLLEGFFEPRELDVIAENKLSTVVHSMEQLAMLEAFPRRHELDVLLKVNTGMNRLGLQPREVGEALEKLERPPGVSRITLMTHFANADDRRGIGYQLTAFEAAAGTRFPRSLANSAALLRYPESHADWVRPGIMLYGCSPFPDSVGSDVELEPAMTLESEIIAVRELAPGDAVGYGSAFVAEQPTRVGVVACGYADGYPRHAPTGTPVLVGGRLTRTLGRVSMDMLCVDLTASGDARVGTRVVLWGKENPVERVAASAGTVGYELLCALAPRVRVTEKS